MKLQQGDYVTDLTEEQFDELIGIEGHKIKLISHKSYEYLVFNGKILTRIEECTNLLPFTEFKQRAINTFEK